MENALKQACDSLNVDSSFVEEFVSYVLGEIQAQYGDVENLQADTLQDVVEIELMKSGRHELARACIIYRANKQVKSLEKRQKLLQKFSNNKLKVTKRDGSKELFSIYEIQTTFDTAVKGFEKTCSFEELMEAFKANIVDEIHTKEISKLLVKTCIDLTSVENIDWLEVASRIHLLDRYKVAATNRKIDVDNIYNGENYLAFFKDYIEKGHYYKDYFKYYSEEDIKKAGDYISKDRDFTYTYSTSLALSKRYLHNPNKEVFELPQEMYMSVALFLAIPEKDEDRLSFAFKVYDACSQQKISLPTPTLVNARTNWHQLSSCFKLNLDDDLRGIYHGVENMAQISKFWGGIGVYLGNLRSLGSDIRGIHNASGGVMPWAKVINDTAIAVNQLGSRLGAISVTLDVWHRDIYDFLEMQTETGDIRSKSFDVFPAITIPDIFMKRVENDEDWTLVDPHEIQKVYGKSLQDTYGEEFEAFYLDIEKNTKLKLCKTTKAKELFKTFLKTVVETGMPYVSFRDTVNKANPNKHAGMIYNTNLCTEIQQNTVATKFVEEKETEYGNISIEYRPGETVVCNLASINIAKVNKEKDIKEIFPIMCRILDNVITLNFYPIKEAELTSNKYRPIGIGYLGLSEYLAVNKLNYDSEEAREVVDALFEKYAYYTYTNSIALAKERGSYALYEGSDYDKGLILNRDVEWYKTNSKGLAEKWEKLFDNMTKYGVRFGYHSAPAPNTSTAGIVGTTAALLPIYKKYFLETNLASPTIRVAPKLNSKNFWFYKEYINMNMLDVIKMIATISPWIDQSISFEWLINPTKVSPKELFGYYFQTWKSGIKTVYYVRSLSSEVDNCVSCSG